MKRSFSALLFICASSAVFFFTAFDAHAAATVDLMVNDSDGPISIVSGASATLSWTTTNAQSCWATDDWTGWKDVPSGSESTGILMSSKIYTLQCWSHSGVASNTDSVVVNVSAPPTPTPTPPCDDNPGAICDPGPTPSPTPIENCDDTPNAICDPGPTPSPTPTSTPPCDDNPGAICDPGPTPTGSPVLTPTLSPTPSPSETPVLTPTLSPSPTPTPTPSPTPTPPLIPNGVISDIRYVSFSLTIDPDTANDPPAVTVQSQVQLRNLKINL